MAREDGGGVGMVAGAPFVEEVMGGGVAGRVVEAEVVEVDAEVEVGFVGAW